MAHAAYEFAIKELDQIKEDELAILKIDTGNYSPVIDQAYIPPCMSVDACSKLLETYGMLKQLVTEILSHIEHKGELFGASLYPLHMLRNELDDFPLSSQPDALIRFMKRIIQTFRFFIPNIRTVDMPDLLRTYNHNDMSLTFKSLLSYLHHVSRIVSQGIEEDFTPRI
jgi:predicted component of type VI protein secretion system